MHSVKMGVAVEAGVDAGLQQGLPFPAQRAGKQQPLVIEVLIDGHAGDGAEDPA